MKKTIPAIGIICIVLFAGISLPTSSIESNNQNIIYVDDDGDADFTRIQDAVNNAHDGDTIFVYSGTYSDFFPDNNACVRIEKNIELIGENKHNTIINGTGFQRVIIIMSEEVSVSGFTIQHGKGKKEKGYILGIDVHHYKTDNISIFDNIITNNSYGIRTHQSSANIKIFDNLITSNYCGIHCEFDSAPLNIYRNEITNNECGIYTYDSDIYLTKNLINNNNVGISNSRSSSNYTILQNEISENKIGINLDTTSSTIKYNNFINNEKEVKTSMDIFSFTFFKFYNYKQKWISNYWEDWNTKIPKAMPGFRIYHIIIFKIHPKLTTPIPIAIFPYFEYDWHPAQEPYDI